MDEIFIKFWRDIVDMGYDESSIIINRYVDALHKYSQASGTLFCKKLDRLTVKNIYSVPQDFDIYWEDEFLNIFESKNKIEILDAEKFGFPNDNVLILLPIISGEIQDAFILLVSKEKWNDKLLSFLENSNMALTQRFKVNGLTEVVAKRNHQFNIIMETIPEAVIYFEEDGNFVWLNTLARTMLKIDMENPKPEIVSFAMQSFRNSANNKEEIIETGYRIFQSTNR